MRHVLITKEIEKALLASPLYSHEKQQPEQVCIIVKFFYPYGSGSWFVTEARKDGNDWLFFGYITGLGDNELGYFRFSELRSIVKFGRPAIERDMHFDRHTLAEVMQGKAR